MDRDEKVLVLSCSSEVGIVVSMELRACVTEWLQGFSRDVPVVVVPVYNAFTDVLECMDSILAATPPAIPVLVIDDASTDARVYPALAQRSTEGQFLYVCKPTNSGYVGTVNLAFALCAPRDVVVVNSDVVVPPAWLERLRAAAYHRSTVATATPLTNHGTIVSVPYRNHPTGELVGGMTVEETDARIQATSLQLYPIIPTAVGHCVYFKRAALDVVGYFDEAFAPGYGEEVDFSQRAVLAGFSHVLVDNLFVHHKGSRSFESDGQDLRTRIQAAHEALIRGRYPWYADWSAQAATDTRSPLARAIERAQAALLGYRIAIDATCIGGPITGTQLLTLELIRALTTDRDPDTHLSLIVHDHVDKSDLLGVDKLVDEVLTLSDLHNLPQPRFNLVHRSFQLRTLEELVFLRKIAHRVIVSVLDFIAFSNPGYAVSYREWEHYRWLTQLACNVVDGVILISRDVARDAVHQGIHIEARRACVISPGVDHRHGENAVIADSLRLPEPPFILVLGTDFRHKNRLYALKLLQALISKHHWEGSLVFAGPTVLYGSSEAEEALFLQRDPEIRSRVSYLGAVSQTEKQWLLEKASLVLYPSAYEGFGLVPFEASAAGVPALTARTTSLIEVLGDDVVYLDTFDPQDGADVVWLLLSDPAAAAAQVAAIRMRMADHTWSAAAAQTWDFYRLVLALPPRFPTAIPWQSSSWSVDQGLPVGGPFRVRVDRRLRRAGRVIMTEWLCLYDEFCQFVRFHYTRWRTRPRRGRARMHR